MNFFEHQDRAKQNTIKLITLFALGVLSLIIAISIVVVLALSAVDPQVANYVLAYGVWAAFEPELLPVFGGVALAVVGIVSIGALVKSWQLSDGGKVVAQSLGGKLLLSNTTDFHEKRALNVVEEMAIASGIAVPPIYILDEDGINAFAAGYGFQDAVIGLTRGSIVKLNRDELQGVVAHEFSHIFHGDMRLNIRIVSWLHGMVVIGILGRIVMRFSHAGSNRSRGKNSGVPVALAIGLTLAVAGYAGSFFGGLIRAALSRQREYLADASAVQYTRNPSGIAGALKKIGAYSMGARVSAAQANEFSHLFFGDIELKRIGSFMATHPPLKSRILRLEPYWNGQFEDITIQEDETPKTKNRSNFIDSGIGKSILLGGIASAGVIGMEQINQAKIVLNQLDNRIYEACHDPFMARIVIYGVLQDKNQNLAKEQFDVIQGELKSNADAKTIYEQLHHIDDSFIVPIVELALPALKSLSISQKKDFYETMNRIIGIDKKLSLFEWAIQTIVQKNLDEQHPPKAHSTLLTCKAHAQVVLSILAYASGSSSQEAFVKSYSMLLVGAPRLLEKSEFNFGLFEHALRELEKLQPKHKERFINAMITCIGYDEIIKPREAQLFKAITLAIGVALPPMLSLQES